jgi:hypothetical protein
MRKSFAPDFKSKIKRKKRKQKNEKRKADNTHKTSVV